jgi:hypothetical protein
MMEVDEIPSEAQELIESLDFVRRKRVSLPCAFHMLYNWLFWIAWKAPNGCQQFKLKLVAYHLLFTHLHHSQENILECSRQQFQEQQLRDGIVYMFLQLAAVNAIKLKILRIHTKHEVCILASKGLKTLQELESLNLGICFVLRIKLWHRNWSCRLLTVDVLLWNSWLKWLTTYSTLHFFSGDQSMNQTMRF